MSDSDYEDLGEVVDDDILYANNSDPFGDDDTPWQVRVGNGAFVGVWDVLSQDDSGETAVVKLEDGRVVTVERVGDWGPSDARAGYHSWGTNEFRIVATQ